MSYFKLLALPTLFILASSPVLSQPSLPSLFKHLSQMQQKQQPPLQSLKKHPQVLTDGPYADFSGTWTLIPDIGDDPLCPGLLENAHLIITNNADFVDFSDQFQSIFSTSIGPVFSYSWLDGDGTSHSSVQYTNWNTGYTTLNVHVMETNRPAENNVTTEDNAVYDIQFSLSGSQLVMLYKTMTVSLDNMNTGAVTSFYCHFQQ